MNLCPLCKSSHNVKHNILNHNEIHYVCSIHNEKFVKYCNSCKLNICILCEENHINHNTIYLGNIIFNKKELEKKINSLKEDINKLNNNINEIIEIANEVKKNYNKYFIILSNMIINYDIKNRNYENLFNLKELLNNDYIIKNINIFNNEINIRNKFDILFNTYKKMQNQKNEIKLSVKINKEDIGKKIYFLDNTSGDIFVNGKFVSNPVFLKQLNESNTQLFINNIYYKYTKYFIPEKEGIYNINIKFKIKLDDCSCMFYNCKNIINIDLSSFDTSNVTRMENMFKFCRNVKYINTSFINTKNVIIMKDMFYGCNNLVKIDLSSFNTQNVKDMSGMFYECNSLMNIDLTSFDTDHVTNMEFMFFKCNNVKYLDLSSFNIKIITNLGYLFYCCNALKFIDLSLFDT